MTREFISTHIFDKRWVSLGLNDDDLLSLQNVLLENPDFGDIIKGTGGARKIRHNLSGSNKGKSGGVRVIYVDLKHKAHLHLLLCYSKDEQDDLTSEQKKQVKTIIQAVKGAKT